MKYEHEHWWGDTETEDLSQCRFVYHKSHIPQPRKMQSLRDVKQATKIIKYCQDLK
jgi:hypothetical protein